MHTEFSGVVRACSSDSLVLVLSCCLRLIKGSSRDPAKLPEVRQVWVEIVVSMLWSSGYTTAAKNDISIVEEVK